MISPFSLFLSAHLAEWLRNRLQLVKNGAGVMLQGLKLILNYDQRACAEMEGSDHREGEIERMQDEELVEAEEQKSAEK